nr:hypothetical protein [Pseudoglutamicibacter albus]
MTDPRHYTNRPSHAVRELRDRERAGAHSGFRDDHCARECCDDPVAHVEAPAGRRRVRGRLADYTAVDGDPLDEGSGDNP